MTRNLLTLASALALLATPAAADTLKIGMITTLSGPGAGLGIDIRDGFALAVEHAGGKLGGQDTQVIEADDQQKPDVAVGLANRMVERDRVQMVTGVVWSNLALAMLPTLAGGQTFFISPNAGPSQLAGAQCNPYFFNAAYQNDQIHEAVGKHVQDEGFKKVYLMAPNYPAGKDGLAGFKRYYKGEVAGEVYTQVGQLDYAAELAQLKAAAPDAVYVFYPGGMGINFIKQYEQAGLKGAVPLFGPGFSFDQDILAAVGESALGVKNSAQWSPDLDNAANKKFVADFKAKYGRIPSMYAAQGYDTALLIDTAVKAVGGNLKDKDTLRAALASAKLQSLRGEVAFNTNHYPIHNIYLREVVKGADGAVTNKTVATVFTNHADAYVKDCPMK
ncbi:ABC transporter substrate-binding protein [Azospirillum brasilense]|uniref:ABC transporter substrate-binding protein n=1 Tax=Azospirillum brasilense TaxID=192 RepID=A0A0N7I813_AZOBR|nr:MULTISPECIES: ABC transporter substrate-binding protein [Azospirillum]ALJ36011.1 ABC transporter substrate-binding protein [Azospirillum brasilense]MDW7552426.1 ABC transporter substrate-binding protein [Azospirillum brasilense]MDW7592384.1 ABC transporter substrate-binding protein [Azospirillum brasilense]MDW7627514.1 ABC transporter substrate-binding protein [Azospirillum brasilense]MDW7628921.1 ABC transporter substrate-binding protein [Azospirillum brasilense]